MRTRGTTVRRPGRREVLRWAGAGAGGLILAACNRPSKSPPSSSGSAAPTGAPTTPAQTGRSSAAGRGSATTPPAAPAELHEAPELTSQVRAGKLPELSDRLPARPYVVPHNWVRRGHYGGALSVLINSTSDDSSVGEWDYGFSPLRYLNDSRTIGPGIVEKWRSNHDASRWEFTLRAGLKWSDGHPVTTADVLFWWNDMADYEAFTAESVPDEGKSGTGTICELTARDKRTWVMHFDAPAPMTADRLAMWTNGEGGNGASWIVPSHFVKRYHPKYAKVPKNWASPGGVWERKCSYRRNPSCPTLTAFRLKKYVDGQSLIWERNPYCYVVTREGDQLPYLDSIVMSVVQDKEVGKLKVAHGEVDLSIGSFNGLVLADVSTLNKAATAGKFGVRTWDSGSGTGSMFFLNQDYKEQRYRNVFRDRRFQRALSHAYNRESARRAVYFNTGAITTGTMSPKSMEFLIDDRGKKLYRRWRDSYAEYDPTKARALLDDMGIKDSDGDGLREFPDGTKLRLRIELQADASNDFVQTSNQRARDWKAVGIDAVVTPVPPTSVSVDWAAGRAMSRSAWEIGGSPNIAAQPQFMVPMEPTRWAPLQGQMYASRGTPAYSSEKSVDPWKRKPPRLMPEDGSPVAQLWKLLNQTKVEPDLMKRSQLVWRMIKVHIEDGPFMQGTVVNYPQPIVVKNGLRNVPTHDDLYLGGWVNPWVHPTPAVYDPSCFYWDDPSEHME